MDKKKYHMRIFRHEDLDLVLLTISDHAIELNDYVQVDKIEECLYAIECGENEFIEIKIQDKPEVIYQFETIIRANTDYASDAESDDTDAYMSDTGSQISTYSCNSRFSMT